MFDPKKLSSYPPSPGVYLMKNAEGIVLYIGKANSLQSRLKQYFIPGRDTRKTVPLLIKEVQEIDTILVEGEKEALLLENTLIKKHRPKFNILLRDDKNYISLSIQPTEAWPRWRFGRFTQKPSDGALHFGPYVSGQAARDTFDLMATLFPLRQCSDAEFARRTRPCLLYDIKRCLAPCVGKCSKPEYTTHVESAIDFLKGNTKRVIDTLTSKMQQAAQVLAFEQAAELLHAIRQIEHVRQSAHLSSQAEGKDTDVIGLYGIGSRTLIVQMVFRQGALINSSSFLFEEVLEENSEVLSSFLLQHYLDATHLPEEILLPFPVAEEKALLSILQDTHKKHFRLYHPKIGKKAKLIALAEENAKAAFVQKTMQSDKIQHVLLSLQESLFLCRFPRVIECFDTSHLAGSHLVAASVCFIDGIYAPQKGRLYHIKDINKGDDYAALRQAITRRLLRAKEEREFPDLLIVDGGIGQLHIALSVLKQLDIVNIDVISIAKDEARHDKGITLEKVHTTSQEEPIIYPFHSPTLFFLQNIRDKAHEKAISFHRKSKSKSLQKSLLDTISGIGPIKKRNLLQRFGSIHNILEQSEETLLSVPKITKKDVEQIKKIQLPSDKSK